MVWFRVDDSLAFHPKVLAAGTAAMGLWVKAGAFSGRELLDGYVPAEVLPSLGNKAQAQALVNVGLWVREEHGWRFHDWRDFNPLKEQVEERRAADAERLRKWRQRKRNDEPDE